MIRLELKGYVGKRCDCQFLGSKENCIGQNVACYAKLLEMRLDENAYAKGDIDIIGLLWIMPPTLRTVDFVRRKDGITVVVLDEDIKYRVFTHRRVKDFILESEPQTGKALSEILKKYDKYAAPLGSNVFPLFKEDKDVTDR
jgi:hypothetical protein